MKPIEVKDNTYIDSKEVNDKDPKFKVGDHVGTSKYKNIFAKEYTPTWSEQVFVIKKVKKKLFHGHLLLMISIVQKLLEHFMKKNNKTQINKDLGQEKSLKEKETNYMSNGKDVIIHLIAELIKIIFKNESVLS